MLEVRNLSVSYGKHRALEGISLSVKPGEIVVILGANGAGKSTLLRAIGGVCEGRVTGEVLVSGEQILGQPPHRVVERGIALVPEGRGIFGDMTVRENLLLGSNPERAREDAQRNFDRLVRLFPKLSERAGQVARTMSGGEQQMVAIGRAMMSNPVILMLDEPSLGLSPLLSKELFQNLKAVREAGLGILLVEQNARLSLGIADRGYLLENGHILREDRAEVLRNDPAVQAAYLGGAAGHAAAPAALAATSASQPATGQAPQVTPPASVVEPPAEMPRALTVRARPAVSVPAGDLVGLDIGALVAGAADRTRPPTPAPVRPDMIPATAAGRGDALRTAVAGIEAAARAARRDPTTPAGLPPLRPSVREARLAPAAGQAGAVPPSAASQSLSIPAADAARPQPRVEIWRRRPGSAQFERTEVRDA